jgi:hypothetical protein
VWSQKVSSKWRMLPVLGFLPGLKLVEVTRLFFVKSVCFGGPLMTLQDHVSQHLFTANCIFNTSLETTRLYNGKECQNLGNKRTYQRFK